MKNRILTPLVVLFIALFAFSCVNEALDLQENELNLFKKSEDFQTFAMNFPDLVDKIDYSS